MMKWILKLVAILLLSGAAFSQAGGAGGTGTGGGGVRVTGIPAANDCAKFVNSNTITTAGAPCSSGGGTGTVTSVGFTGGLLSVGTPTTTPAFTVAGTSGGIPYFSGAATWASSGALTANLPVIGGGAGVAPTVGSRTGNTTQFASWTGATTAGRCVDTDANGNLQIVAADCNTSGGSGTVTSVGLLGTANQITVTGASPITTSGSWTLSIPATLALGTDATTAGTLTLSNGAGGGAHTIWSSGATTTNTVQGPATVPTTGHLLDCTTTSTTCLLHDSGVVTANVVNASSPGVGIAHFAGSTQTVTSSAVDLSGADATGTMAAARMPALTGDATTSAGAVATTVKLAHWNEASVNNAASPYTVLSTDTVISCDATAGAVTITLPAATGTGRYLIVKKIDSSANACTPTRAGSDLIDGASSYSLTVQYAASAIVDTASAVWSRTHVNQLGGDLSGISTAATVAKINGTSFAGTSGHLVSFGAANIPADSGVVAANVVTSAASLTSTAIMTGGGSQTSQTPSATATLNSSGNMSLPGTLAVTGHDTFEGVTSTGATGTGKFVFDTTPTLVTPVIGVATGTSLATTSFLSTGTAPSCTAGTGGVLCQGEGTAPTAASAVGQLYTDSTLHDMAVQTNGGAKGIMWHSAPGQIRSTGLTAAVSTATLCAATAGACNQAGHYTVQWTFYEGGTACATPGTGGVTFLLTWTDGNGTAHSAVSLPMDDATSLVATSGTFHFQTSLGAAWASGNFNIDTNGSIIQYATGYTACTSGTGNYALSAVVTRMQ